MFIISVTAYADFDIPYEVNGCSKEDAEKYLFYTKLNIKAFILFLRFSTTSKN